jgi:hypothetical protein
VEIRQADGRRQSRSATEVMTFDLVCMRHQVRDASRYEIDAFVSDIDATARVAPEMAPGTGAADRRAYFA